MNDIIQFYAFSADKPVGEGTGDSIQENPIQKNSIKEKQDKNKYDGLRNYPNWRRMFSSFWSEDPFVFENRTYLSYEHAYQQAKFRINGFVEEADKFSIESNTTLSKMTGKDVQKAGRNIKLTNNQIKIWDDNVSIIKQQLYEAKFTLTSRPGIVLLLTVDAMLINAGPRIKKIHCTRLEELRTKLKLQLVGNQVN